MHAEAFDQLTLELAKFNEHRLTPGCLVDTHPREIEYIEAIRSKVPVPQDVSVEWYELLLHDGPGQNDPLFQWLAEEATLEQMTWFLCQEAAGEAGFGDLVAMTQVKMPARAKMEMARNYWDEMGRGDEAGMHDKLLRSLIDLIGAKPSVETTVLPSLTLANLMVGLASHRRYAFQSVGALGVIEMTAPARVDQVDKALMRLGFSKQNRQYFALHATLDIKHSREWNREVLESLAADHMQEMAEGAYLRLWCGQQCYERYRQEFGLTPADQFELSLLASH